MTIRDLIINLKGTDNIMIKARDFSKESLKVFDGNVESFMSCPYRQVMEKMIISEAYFTNKKVVIIFRATISLVKECLKHY